MDEQRPWHRLFGLSWADFFRGLPVTVELEKDLSVKKQLLDVVLIRKEPGVLSCRLKEALTMPDLLEEFTRETIDQFLKQLPVEKRLEGLSAEALFAALSPQFREALARLLKANGAEPKPE